MYRNGLHLNSLKRRPGNLLEIEWKKRTTAKLPQQLIHFSQVAESGNREDFKSLSYN